MAGMFTSGSTWICLIVGVVALVAAAVLFASRGRLGGGRRGPRGNQWPMLLSIGLMAISSSVAQAGKSTSVKKTAALLVIVASVATIVFAIRLLYAQRQAASRSPEDAR
jgi:hypothetical protein